MSVHARRAVRARVPASSANLGPGFDALGLALDLHATVGIGPAPPEARIADRHHPATVAFRRAGGTGEIWVVSPIPMARGLGFSGAMRVGGTALALAVEHHWSAGPVPEPARHEIVSLAGSLEGHADNAAASTYGGVVAVAGGQVVPIRMVFDAVVVLWVPPATTSTDRSRARLPATVPFDDAVFNIGRTALLVAALATGDRRALRAATEDRLHQERRMAQVPAAADVLQAGLDAGAWCGWLSGSGPTVALLCDAQTSATVTDAVALAGSSDGDRTRVHGIDRAGVVILPER